MERILNQESLYSDVLKMYQVEGGGAVFNEYPIFIRYEDEEAINDGGVQQDMFSAFWSSCYVRLFEGAKPLTPMIQPGIDITNFSTLSNIISHGYLACGYLPHLTL